MDVRGGLIAIREADLYASKGAFCPAKKKKKSKNHLDFSAHIKPRSVSATQVHSHLQRPAHCSHPEPDLHLHFGASFSY